MRNPLWSVAVCAAMMGTALAQVGASSGVYLLDVDPARYAGPAGQRLILRIGDVPRRVSIGAQEAICVQLFRVANAEEIVARVRSLGPEPHSAEVRVVGPDISPGTFRTTPWGMLLRALPGLPENRGLVPPLVTDQAPVCAL